MLDENKQIKKKQTVLVGMTGRMDSTVSAYLLKKQGYHCIGICLQPFRDEEIGSQVFKQWFVEDMNKVKTICETLEMPFYGVNAQEVYKDKVADFVIANALAGKSFSPSIYSTQVIIETLYKKMKTLKADFIATGHFAKIHQNHKTGECSVMVANDLENDQSYDLTKTDPMALERLLLPLAEMRRIEVEKVAALINVDLLKGLNDRHHNLMKNSLFKKFLEESSPASLRKKGSVINYREDSICFDHDGTHHFHIGQNRISPQKKIGIMVDSKMEVIDIHPASGSVYLDYPDNLYHTHCYLREFTSQDLFDSSTPGEFYIQFEQYGEKIPCYAYYKNNDSVLIEFKQRREGLLERGVYAALYNKRKGGKVVGGGIIDNSGFIEEGEWHRFPLRKSDQDEEEEVKRREELQF